MKASPKAAIGDINDLNRVRDEVRARKRGSGRGAREHLLLCAGGGCIASGEPEIKLALLAALKKRGLENDIAVVETGCLGPCAGGPVMVVGRDGTFYQRLTPADAREIVDKHLVRGKVVDHLTVRQGGEKTPVPLITDIEFFKRQTKVVLRNCGRIDPTSIEDYIGSDGYQAAAKVLLSMTPEKVVDEMKRSGLRGRGGAGFPTGQKWEFARQSPGALKYILCNADEGDPGAYMDRSVLEGDPHSVIEGMMVGAFAIGSSQGYVYVRAEYPLAVERLQHAIESARAHGLLGKNILGTGFAFDLEIRMGSGAFVCGEETALMASIEGRRGEPRPRPPFPAQKGLWDKPTVLNNVETFANVPVIILGGGDKFACVGTGNSKGTKVFALAGAINNTGLVEVPIGTSLREVVFDIGGGIPNNKAFKAAQIGGPSGGCIPRQHLDVPLDYDALTSLGAIMGSGGLIVMDESACMVDVARFFLEFIQDESCGKCNPCREGTLRMLQIVRKICGGSGTLEDLDRLISLAGTVKTTSLCGLGQTAPNPVLSTLRHFKEEYIRHIVDKRCDAFVCKELTGAPCQAACPIGTEAWRYVAHAARGEYAEAYAVIRETNPFPSICARVCDHNCELRCRLGASGDSPVAIRALKRFITDQADPSAYKPRREKLPAGLQARIAVVGSGPAGLTAAHYLSLKGYAVTVFEADREPGGMLLSGIPEYRLPHGVLRKEIKSLLNDNITVKCASKLGKDFTVDSLMREGYKAVFLSLGAHHSLKLDIEGADAKGVYPSMAFLRAYNLEGKNLARGRVGVVGGGNSAIDAARVALRQKGVKGVTLYYRRSREEMPAFPAEIQAAIDEGVKLETLVSPKRICVGKGAVSKVEFIRNALGEVDAGGRRGFSAVPGSEHAVPMDTLIIAISEQVTPFAAEGSEGIGRSKWGGLQVEADTLCTTRPGVFAGGDAVTGPNSVVNAIAAGKRAADVIDRYLRGQALKEPAGKVLPKHYIEPTLQMADDDEPVKRAELPTLSLRERRTSCAEVEKALSPKNAVREARRCLRCDLEFTSRHDRRTPETNQEKR